MNTSDYVNATNKQQQSLVAMRWRTFTADEVKAYIDRLDLSALAEVLSYGAEAYKRAIIQERARQKEAALPLFLCNELQNTLGDLIEVCEGKNYWHDSTGKAYQYKMRADNTREFVNAIKAKADKLNERAKHIIHNTVFMAKKDGEEQFAWNSFNNYFNRNAK